MSKQRNPNIDFGFHAVVPRLIRTGYDMLTPAQKWIYVCLKDLCGDDGTCYRALRTLAEETHVSTGLLSESIPTLHKVGLIHAEKKKRSSGGKEVWHITIADIWQANAKAHPTKRSQREQSPSDERSQNEQTISTDDTDVQNVNQNVHKMNDDSRERSHSEQECSFCETEVITLSNNNIEVITERDNTRITAIADDATPSPSFAGEDDGTHNRHNASRTVSSNDDNVIGNPPNPLEDPHRVVPAQQQTATPTEKPQLNRLTNPPEPPTQENVSTDESPRGIASETANDTASLPVVNAANDEVIHTDTRNDGDSYSPSNTATQETTPAQPEAAEPPATGKGSGKRSGGKGGNKKTTKKPDLSPIAPPARPDPDAPFNAEKILAWGDYGRKAMLPESNRRDSRAFKAIEAARKIEGFGISEDLFLTLYFNWMKGVKVDLTDLPEGAIKSDTWPDYTVDLWVFAQYFEQERKRYNDRKREVERAALKAQQLAKGIVSTATKIAGYTRQFDTDDEDIVYQSKAEKAQRKRA